ncbi:hypothetical protein K440DRAFT_662623 [Wilcoxina mikolae CBS 423.85]|nr:hypothetical protein K440DRAFT_662623 [Wilcoxina mikolae CBS 423.85]
MSPPRRLRSKNPAIQPPRYQPVMSQQSQPCCSCHCHQADVPVKTVKKRVRIKEIEREKDCAFLKENWGEQWLENVSCNGEFEVILSERARKKLRKAARVEGGSASLFGHFLRQQMIRRITITVTTERKPGGRDGDFYSNSSAHRTDGNSYPDSIGNAEARNTDSGPLPVPPVAFQVEVPSRIPHTEPPNGLANNTPGVQDLNPDTGVLPVPLVTPQTPSQTPHAGYPEDLANSSHGVHDLNLGSGALPVPPVNAAITFQAEVLSLQTPLQTLYAGYSEDLANNTHGTQNPPHGQRSMPEPTEDDDTGGFELGSDEHEELSISELWCDANQSARESAPESTENDRDQLFIEVDENTGRMRVWMRID